MLLRKIRVQSPLIHHITNQVVMNFVANGTLAVGGSPVMSHHAEEVEEMVSHAQALVINIGTLDPGLVEAAALAGKKANQLNIPVVLDPVGVGAIAFRRRAVTRLIDEVSFAVICGNRAELSFLAKGSWEGKGVDAGSSAAPIDWPFEAVMALTGETDYVNHVAITGGHPLLARVTGTGCLATSLIGLFLAVEQDAQKAAVHALSMLKLAGEMAGAKASGPGSFVPALLDALYHITPEQLEKRVASLL